MPSASSPSTSASFQDLYKFASKFRPGIGKRTLNQVDVPTANGTKQPTETVRVLSTKSPGKLWSRLSFVERSDRRLNDEAFIKHLIKQATVNNPDMAGDPEVKQAVAKLQDLCTQRVAKFKPLRLSDLKDPFKTLAKAQARHEAERSERAYKGHVQSLKALREGGKTSPASCDLNKARQELKKDRSHYMGLVNTTLHPDGKANPQAQHSVWRFLRSLNTANSKQRFHGVKFDAGKHGDKGLAVLGDLLQQPELCLQRLEQAKNRMNSPGIMPDHQKNACEDYRDAFYNAILVLSETARALGKPSHTLPDAPLAYQKAMKLYAEHLNNLVAALLSQDNEPARLYIKARELTLLDDGGSGKPLLSREPSGALKIDFGDDAGDDSRVSQGAGSHEEDAVEREDELLNTRSEGESEGKDPTHISDSTGLPNWEGLEPLSSSENDEGESSRVSASQ